MMEQAATDIDMAALLVATAAVLVAILGSSLMTLGLLLRQINRLEDKIDNKIDNKIDGLDKKFSDKIDEASREQREATDKLRDVVMENGQRLARMEGMLAATMPDHGAGPLPTQAHEASAQEQPSRRRSQGPQAAAG